MAIEHSPFNYLYIAMRCSMAIPPYDMDNPPLNVIYLSKVVIFIANCEFTKASTHFPGLRRDAGVRQVPVDLAWVAGPPEEILGT